MQDTTTYATPRWIKVALGLSLAANLVVAGLVAGAALRHGDGRPDGPRNAGFGAYGLPYMMALPRKDRRTIREAVTQEAGEPPNRAARRALYEDVLVALRTEPFDPAMLAAAVGQQAETTLAVQMSAQSAWLTVMSGMTREDRIAYADKVQEVLERGPKGRPGHK